MPTISEFNMKKLRTNFTINVAKIGWAIEKRQKPRPGQQLEQPKVRRMIKRHVDYLDKT